MIKNSNIAKTAAAIVGLGILYVLQSIIYNNVQNILQNKK